MRLGPFGRKTGKDAEGPALREWRRLKAEDDELRVTMKLYDLPFAEQQAWNFRLTRAAVAAREEQTEKGLPFPP